MNGNEKNVALSMSGLMSLNVTRESAKSLIEESDYCVGADWELVYKYLDNILKGVDEHESDLPEDLFEI